MSKCFAILQGVFVRRHQIDKEDGTGRLTPADLAVGQTVTIYGRTFILIDADVFTRNWWVSDAAACLARCASCSHAEHSAWTACCTCSNIICDLLRLKALYCCRYVEKLELTLGAPGEYPADPVDEYREHFGLSTKAGRLTENLLPLSATALLLMGNAHVLPASEW